MEAMFRQAGIYNPFGQRYEPEDKKQAAKDLATQTGSCLCALVGHTAILYRPHPEEPEIKLPR